jgi:hypothetical protein
MWAELDLGRHMFGDHERSQCYTAHLSLRQLYAVPTIQDQRRE